MWFLFLCSLQLRSQKVELLGGIVQRGKVLCQTNEVSLHCADYSIIVKASRGIKVQLEVTDLVHDKFKKSVQAMRQIWQRFIDIKTKIASLSDRIRDLWRELTSLMSYNIDLQVEQGRWTQMI